MRAASGGQPAAVPETMAVRVPGPHLAGPATVKVYVPESAPAANLTVSTLVPDTPQLTGTAAVETYAPDPSGSNAKTWPPENSGGRNCGAALVRVDAAEHAPTPSQGPVTVSVNGMSAREFLNVVVLTNTLVNTALYMPAPDTNGDSVVVGATVVGSMVVGDDVVVAATVVGGSVVGATVAATTLGAEAATAVSAVDGVTTTDSVVGVAVVEAPALADRTRLGGSWWACTTSTVAAATTAAAPPAMA